MSWRVMYFMPIRVRRTVSVMAAQSKRSSSSSRRKLLRLVPQMRKIGKLTCAQRR